MRIKGYQQLRSPGGSQNDKGLLSAIATHWKSSSDARNLSVKEQAVSTRKTKESAVDKRHTDVRKKQGTGTETRTNETGNRTESSLASDEVWIAAPDAPATIHTASGARLDRNREQHRNEDRSQIILMLMEI